MTIKSYGSVNGQTKEIKKLYGSVGELTSISGEIRSGGAGNISAFDGGTFLAKLKSTSLTEGYEYADGVYGEINYIRVYVTSGPYYMIELHTKNNKTRSNGYGMRASGLASWGITAIDESLASGSDYIDVTTNYFYESKKIKKLYGSVEQTLLDYTNQNDVRIDKDIFRTKTSDAGMTSDSGTIEIFRMSSQPQRIRYVLIRPTEGSSIPLVSSYVDSSTAAQALSDYGIYVTTAYLDSITRTDAYVIISRFSFSYGYGTKLILEDVS